MNFINLIILATCGIVTEGELHRLRRKETIEIIVNRQDKMIRELDELVRKQGTEIDHLKKTLLDWTDRDVIGENRITSPYASSLEKRKIVGKTIFDLNF
jgi:uncharacterized coiled-coil protein SlyX